MVAPGVGRFHAFDISAKMIDLVRGGFEMYPRPCFMFLTGLHFLMNLPNTLTLCIPSMSLSTWTCTFNGHT